ncbi:MAG: hypothetical protein NZ929_04125 [Aigarchaeota archaeon]|nr:hypothetical protein [Aigarchaeota archaeon]MCX8193396.1 hypothetical protein [Nitrososphaeria archaeon]
MENLRFCRECGAKLFYDRTLKEYVCKSCGLTYTFQDLVIGSDRILTEDKYKKDERKKIRKEYLEWWLSKK